MLDMFYSPQRSLIFSFANVCHYCYSHYRIDDPWSLWNFRYHHNRAVLTMWSGIRYRATPIWIFVLFNSFVHSSCTAIMLPLVLVFILQANDTLPRSRSASSLLACPLLLVISLSPHAWILLVNVLPFPLMSAIFFPLPIFLLTLLVVPMASVLLLPWHLKRLTKVAFYIYSYSLSPTHPASFLYNICSFAAFFSFTLFASLNLHSQSLLKPE